MFKFGNKAINRFGNKAIKITKSSGFENMVRTPISKLRVNNFNVDYRRNILNLYNLNHPLLTQNFSNSIVSDPTNGNNVVVPGLVGNENVEYTNNYLSDIIVSVCDIDIDITLEDEEEREKEDEEEREKEDEEEREKEDEEEREKEDEEEREKEDEEKREKEDEEKREKEDEEKLAKDTRGVSNRYIGILKSYLSDIKKYIPLGPYIKCMNEMSETIIQSIVEIKWNELNDQESRFTGINYEKKCEFLTQLSLALAKNIKKQNKLHKEELNKLEKTRDGNIEEEIVEPELYDTDHDTDEEKNSIIDKIKSTLKQWIEEIKLVLKRFFSETIVNEIINAIFNLVPGLR